MGKFKIHEEVTNQEVNEWRLYFQYGTYSFDDGTEPQTGYRFIWRRNGRLQPARGQARIPSKQHLTELLDLATEEGWY